MAEAAPRAMTRSALAVAKAALKIARGCLPVYAIRKSPEPQDSSSQHSVAERRLRPPLREDCGTRQAMRV
jgi:hypothetical protein